MKKPTDPILIHVKPMKTTPKATTDTVDRARKFAIDKHRGQRYGKHQYIAHVVRVVAILVEFGYESDPVVMSAAWLHDILQETHTSREELQKAFGIPVSYVVWALTPEYGINRIDRLQGLIAKLKSSKAATIVKIADCIANIEFYKAKSDARMYLIHIKEILYLKEMLYRPKQKMCADLMPLWQRLLTATALNHRDTRETVKMTSVYECLAGVLITRELAEAIAAFEFRHGDKTKDVNAFANLDEVAGDYVKALVKFTRDALTDEDNFYQQEDNKAGVITLMILENGAGAEMLDAYDIFEDKIGIIEGGDEAYNLTIEVINAIVLKEESKDKDKK